MGCIEVNINTFPLSADCHLWVPEGCRVAWPGSCLKVDFIN